MIIVNIVFTIAVKELFIAVITFIALGLPERLLKYSPLPSPGRSASRRYTFTSKSHSSNSSDQSSEDLTMDALIVVIQDPDKGVPRACTGSLEHVKIHRGNHK